MKRSVASSADSLEENKRKKLPPLISLVGALLLIKNNG